MLICRMVAFGRGAKEPNKEIVSDALNIFQHEISSYLGLRTTRGSECSGSAP